MTNQPGAPRSRITSHRALIFPASLFESLIFKQDHPIERGRRYPRLGRFGPAHLQTLAIPILGHSPRPFTTFG